MAPSLNEKTEQAALQKAPTEHDTGVLSPGIETKIAQTVASVATQHVPGILARMSTIALNAIPEGISALSGELATKASAVAKTLEGMGGYLGSAAAVVGGIADYAGATKLEHKSTTEATFGAVTTAVSGIGVAVAGVGAVPGVVIGFVANEVAREGAHALGMKDVESGVIRKHIEAFPERLKTELSMGEAQKALQDPSSPAYQALANTYKDAFAHIQANRHGTPAEFGANPLPATADEYAKTRIKHDLDKLHGLPPSNDVPSGIPRPKENAEVAATGVTAPPAAPAPQSAQNAQFAAMMAQHNVTIPKGCSVAPEGASCANLPNKTQSVPQQSAAR